MEFSFRTADRQTDRQTDRHHTVPSAGHAVTSRLVGRLSDAINVLSLCYYYVNTVHITVLILRYHCAINMLTLCYHCAILPCDVSMFKHRWSITVPNITDRTAVPTASDATKQEQRSRSCTSLRLPERTIMSFDFSSFVRMPKCSF